jgi:hypothetical protein
MLIAAQSAEDARLLVRKTLPVNYYRRVR